MPDQSSRQIGWDMTEPRAALASFFATLPNTPQLLALGEPTHGVEALPDWRNRIFRTLVRDHGFRSITIESDIIAGLRVNAYVTSNQEALDEVMRTGFSHSLGKSPANRELVEWMRDFNAGREPADHLRFYGFDAPLENLWAASPRASLLALHAFLSAHLSDVPIDTATLERLCGEDGRWTNPEAGMDATKSIGNTDEARQLRLLADDLCSLLQTEMPYLAARAGYWEAELHARTAAGLLRYHAIVADPAPTRVARMLRQRDLMMADNLSAIAEREQGRGSTLVFAHNSHLQRNLSTMNMRGTNLEWWSAGAHVSTRLGNQYAFIAGVLGSSLEEGIAESARDALQSAPSNSADSASLFSAGELNAAVNAGDLPLEMSRYSLAAGVLFVRNAAN